MLTRFQLLTISTGFSYLAVPQDMSSFLEAYLPLNSSQPAKPPPSALITNAETFNKVMDYVLDVGYEHHFQRIAGCAPKKITGRWWKAMSCSAIAAFSRTMCPSVHLPPVVCSAEVDEFFQSFEDAIRNPANQCSPSALSEFQGIAKKSTVRSLSTPETCLSGKTFEGRNLCGYPSVAQACAHNCTDPDFVQLSGNGDVKATCAEALKTAGITDTDIRNDSTPTNTQEEDLGWLYRRFGGIQAMYWLIGATTLVAFIAFTAAVLVATSKKRKLSKNRKVAETTVALSESNFDPPTRPNSARPLPSLSPIQALNSKSYSPTVYGTKRNISMASSAIRTSMLARSISAHDSSASRRVVLSYMPRLEDELEIHTGESVIVWEEYGDGYAFGELPNGEQGVFPLMCLSQDDDTFRRRRSSHNRETRSYEQVAEQDIQNSSIEPPIHHLAEFTMKSGYSS